MFVLLTYLLTGFSLGSEVIHFVYRGPGVYETEKHF